MRIVTTIMSPQRRVARASALVGAFTLVEMMVVIAIIALILATFIGVGGRLRGSASIRKTKATMAVLEVAVDQFYTEKGFYPDHIVDCLDISTREYAVQQDQLDFYNDASTRLNAVQYNGAILRWQLLKSVGIRANLEKISPKNLVELDSGLDFSDLPSSSLTRHMTPKDPDDVDYRYFIDAFGLPINYQARGGAGGVPVLISAGPDGDFGDPDGNDDERAATKDNITAGRN